MVCSYSYRSPCCVVCCSFYLQLPRARLLTHWRPHHIVAILFWAGVELCMSADLCRLGVGRWFVGSRLVLISHAALQACGSHELEVCTFGGHPLLFAIPTLLRPAGRERGRMRPHDDDEAPLGITLDLTAFVLAQHCIGPRVARNGGPLGNHG